MQLQGRVQCAGWRLLSPSPKQCGWCRMSALRDLPLHYMHHDLSSR